MSWKRRPILKWRADLSETDPAAYADWCPDLDNRGERSLGIDFAGVESELPVWVLQDGRGTSNGGFVGVPDVEVDRVVAHWVNLPAFGGTHVHAHRADDNRTWSTWPGRATFLAAGWEIVLDALIDHAALLKSAQDDELAVVTHVMQLRRIDASPFTAEEAQLVLEGLQLAVSFALGRWACPAAATGLDADGRLAWSYWQPARADPPRLGLGWWDNGRVDPDFDSLLDLFLSQWLRVGMREFLNVPVVSAILAVETGFVEQRLMTAVAAIELLSWITDVRENGIDEQVWRDAGPAWKRIDKLLGPAKISPVMSADRTPELLAYAKRRHSTLNGAWAVADIRNRITHPKDNSDLYANPLLLGEASRLALRYLELLILFRLGYSGRAEDRTHVGRWSGDSAPVPWG